MHIYGIYKNGIDVSVTLMSCLKSKDFKKEKKKKWY